MISETHEKNHELFRDCISTTLIEKLSKGQPKSRRRAKKSGKSGRNSTSPEAQAAKGEAEEARADPAEFADFIDYIATETFECLPEELKTTDYHAYIKDTDLQERYALRLTGSDIATLTPSLDPSIPDSLTAYGILQEPNQGINEFLAPVLTTFITALSTPPPAPRSTKADAQGCELCGRDWINLSYHHLVPRFVHAKALKRGWHREEDLQSVAWLCGACHRFVHQFAGHEELARRYYTVELLLEQEPVVQFAKWVGRLRWKKR